jgi:hypothetical protein
VKLPLEPDRQPSIEVSLPVELVEFMPDWLPVLD